MEIWMVLLGWLLFAGTHIGLSSDPVRSGLIGKTGEKGFQGIYSLVALATFAFLVFVYVKTKATGPYFLEVGKDSVPVQICCNLLMVLALILFVGGFFNRTPMGMPPAESKAYGITRITRHPMNMAFALFGLSHILTNRFAVDWFFYGGFILFGFFGALHQDGRKVKNAGRELQEFVSNTSIVPFVAITAGKQKFKLGEISKIGLLLGIVLAVVARILHPTI